MRLTALFLAIAVTSANAENEYALRLLDRWILSVDQHAAGEPDAALADVTESSFDQIDLMRGYIDALLGLPPNTRERDVRRGAVGRDLAAIEERARNLRTRGDFDEFKRRAVILHTDAALLGTTPVVVAPRVVNHDKPLWRRGETAPEVDVKSFDGRVERFELANPHWQVAMDVLETLPAKPQRDPIVARWYRAVGAHFAREHNFADAFRHFERARSVVPDDPDVLFGEACYRETQGSPRVQNLQRVTRLPNGLVLVGAASAGTHHRRAEGLLKRALAARPDFAEARLRLGRVLSEQRQYAAALPHFAQVVSDSLDPRLIHYAHLFAGEAALALGRVSESRASYERALASFPRSQSARLGLGAALRAGGDRATALEEVMKTVTIPADERYVLDDPWWEYYEGDATNVERLLLDLRAPFTTPRR